MPELRGTERPEKPGLPGLPWASPSFIRLNILPGAASPGRTRWCCTCHDAQVPLQRYKEHAMHAHYDDPAVTPPDGLPPQIPRKRRHWIGWTAAGVGALIVASIGVGGGSGGGNSAGPVISSPATSVSSAGKTTVGTVQDWATSAGYKKMIHVQDDVENVSADASALDTNQVEADGAILAQDARAAAQDPTPVDAADYSAAMTAYASSGDEMAAGNFQAATLLLRHGTDLLGKVVAQIPAGA